MRKAQSLVELGVLGSIFILVVGFLLSYGLRMNYNQNLGMYAFRYAYKKAKEEMIDQGRHYGGYAASEGVSIMVIKPKPFISLENILGAKNWQILTVSSSALRSNDMLLEWDEKDWGKVENLPRIILNVDGREFPLFTAGWGIVHAIQCKWTCYGEEEDFCVPECTTLINIREKADDDNDTHNLDGFPGSDGIYWYWKSVNVDEVGSGYYYDLDDDDKEELVISVDKKNGIIKYLDFQKGLIDTTLNSKDLKEGKKGFFYNEYEKNETTTGSFSIKEDEKSSASTTQLNSTTKFKIKIRLNPNRSPQVVSYFEEACRRKGYVEGVDGDYYIDGDFLYINVNKNVNKKFTWRVEK